MRKNLLLGALGGALGGLAMKAMVAAVDPRSFGLSATTDAKTAQEIWQRMGWNRLESKSAEQLGAAMHYAFAIATGAGYGGLCRQHPAIRAGRGAVFGAALWVTGDELAVTASGLENPWRTPAFSHLSALAAHVLFGLILDSVQGRSPESKSHS